MAPTPPRGSPAAPQVRHLERRVGGTPPGGPAAVDVGRDRHELDVHRFGGRPPVGTADPATCGKPQLTTDDQARDVVPGDDQRQPAGLVVCGGNGSQVSELAKCADSRPDPSKGVVRSRFRLGALIPPPSHAVLVRRLEWATRALLSFGVTSFTDPGVGRSGLQAYEALADSGRLVQHVRTCIAWVSETERATTPHAVDPVIEGQRFARPNLSTNGVKFVLDGIPGEA
jgi:hypothetical protein